MINHDYYQTIVDKQIDTIANQIQPPTSLKDTNANIDAIQTQVNAVSTALNTTNATLANTNNRVTVLETAKTATNNAITILNQQMAAANEWLGDLQTEMNALDTQMDAIVASMTTLTTKVNTATTTVAASSATITELTRLITLEAISVKLNSREIYRFRRQFAQTTIPAFGGIYAYPQPITNTVVAGGDKDVIGYGFVASDITFSPIPGIIVADVQTVAPQVEIDVTNLYTRLYSELNGYYPEALPKLSWSVSVQVNYDIDNAGTFRIFDSYIHASSSLISTSPANVCQHSNRFGPHLSGPISCVYETKPVPVSTHPTWYIALRLLNNSSGGADLYSESNVQYTVKLYSNFNEN